MLDGSHQFLYNCGSIIVPGKILILLPYFVSFLSYRPKKEKKEIQSQLLIFALSSTNTDKFSCLVLFPAALDYLWNKPWPVVFQT